MRISILVSLCFIFLMVHLNGSAQYYGKLNYMRPTGNAGYIYKTTIGLEGGKLNGFEGGKTRTRTYVGGVFLRPRQESFDFVTYYSEGNDLTILPRVDQYPFSLRITGGAGLDMALFSTNGISPYLGVDGVLGMEFTKMTFGGSSEFAGLVLAGVKARAGIEKEFDRMTLLLEWNTVLTFNMDKIPFVINELGVAIILN